MFNNKSIVWLVFCGLLVFAFSLCSFGALADIYLGDVGIESDPAVVFTENFEEGSIGAVRARWESVQKPDIMSLVPDTPPLSSGNNSILLAHVEGDPSGYLYRRLLPGYDQLYLRFYVKFAPDCHLIHHFVHMGGYNPSTPWPMGGAGDTPVGNDRLTTGVEPFGSSWRWDFYSYWMEMRSWQTSGGVPDPGNPNPAYYGNTFIRDNNLAVVRGEWICVELMMKMNNPTTSHNGEQAIWINGLPWYMGGQLVSHLGEGFPNGYWNTDKWYPNPGSPPFEGFRWRISEGLNWNFVWL